MKILIINKFLYQNGGSETYIFEIGKQLRKMRHEVQYFGMKNENNIVGNEVKSYSKEMDFHNSSLLTMIRNSFQTIYNFDARKKIRKVLEDFKPDVCHINNFNYQLTPSIILEIKKWNRNCKIVYTAHDGQLVCPNHFLMNQKNKKICYKCIDGDYFNCSINKCIHNSYIKSFFGMVEAYFWKLKKVYRKIDIIICPSKFIEDKIKHNRDLQGKRIILHNFSINMIEKRTKKKDYVLYFGRYSEEKGIKTLINACNNLTNITFVFAGSGPLKKLIKGNNILEVGYKKGVELEKLISEAKFSIYPSECNENCPFSIIESISLGTPVLASNIGGIPELIEKGVTGELFESANERELTEKIVKMYNSNFLSFNHSNTYFCKIEDYCKELIEIYGGH